MRQDTSVSHDIAIWLICCAILGGLVGCIGNAPAPISSACVWEKILHPSPQDTIGTLRQIDEHNKAVRANCPGL